MTEGYKISRLTMLWIVIFLVFASFMSFVVTFKLTNDYWRAELVRRGHAKWVVTNEKGAVEWQWTASK